MFLFLNILYHRNYRRSKYFKWTIFRFPWPPVLLTLDRDTYAGRPNTSPARRIHCPGDPHRSPECSVGDVTPAYRIFELSEQFDADIRAPARRETKLDTTLSYRLAATNSVTPAGHAACPDALIQDSPISRNLKPERKPRDFPKQLARKRDEGMPDSFQSSSPIVPGCAMTGSSDGKPLPHLSG